MARAAYEVAGLSRRLGADLVHANSIRAGLVASLATHLGAPRPVVHVRDILPARRLTRTTFAALARGAEVLVANSAYTADRVDRVSGRTRVRVVHNPVDLSRFDPSRHDRTAQRRRLDLADGQFTAALVAQLTPWKGQDDAIRAISFVKERHTDIRLLLVGAATFVDRATRFDNRAYVEELHELVQRLGVAANVAFLGDRDDVPAILAAADVVLLPSWEEPFGRAAAEGMAMGVPVLATSIGGTAEIITDGTDGLLIPPREPRRWAEALQRVIDDVELRQALGRAARERALTVFEPGAHANAMLAIYGEVLAARK
jgi:glycosyltransferase involved in cell wall biosynthesis